MGAFIYGVSLQWKLDIRSKTLLITCYIVPLLFFGIMGGIFTSVIPGAGDTLIQSMTVFGVTMGALIGLPPSLVEIYGSDIKKVYLANGVPFYLGIALANISAFIHLFIMSIILYIAAPLAFDAKIPENPGVYFASLSILCTLGISPAPAFVDDFPSYAHKFNQRTFHVRLINLCTSDKKSSHKIRHKETPRVHFLLRYHSA